MKTLNPKQISYVTGGLHPHHAGGGGFGGAAGGAVSGVSLDSYGKVVRGEEVTVAGAIGAATAGAISGAIGGNSFVSGAAGVTGGLISEGFIKDVQKYREKQERESSDNSSRVICTHFYQKGMLSRELWRADMEFTLKYLPQTMINGYHLWAIPYVRLMRKYPIAEKVIYPLALWRAREIAYKMGISEYGSIRGKIIRTIFEPICLFLGYFSGQKKYQELWS